MTEPKRYEPCMIDVGGGPVEDMREKPTGEYVLYADFQESERKREAAEKERDKAIRARKHTWEWTTGHYGKLEDWARKILPEPWRNQFFSCVANGLYDFNNLGTPYMSKGAGMITPSNYFKMETAQEQLLHDHMKRAEEAELKLASLKGE